MTKILLLFIIIKELISFYQLEDMQIFGEQKYICQFEKLLRSKIVRKYNYNI
jgi:hypothetical protein